MSDIIFIWGHTITMVSGILVSVDSFMACHLLGAQPSTHPILTFSQLHPCILINCCLEFASFQSQKCIWKTIWTMSCSSLSCQRVNEGSIHKKSGLIEDSIRKKSGLVEGSIHKKSGLVGVMTWHWYGVKTILQAVLAKMSDIMTMGSGILVNVGLDYGCWASRH